MTRKERSARRKGAAEASAPRMPRERGTRALMKGTSAASAQPAAVIRSRAVRSTIALAFSISVALFVADGSPYSLSSATSAPSSYEGAIYYENVKIDTFNPVRGAVVLLENLSESHTHHGCLDIDAADCVLAWNTTDNEGQYSFEGYSISKGSKLAVLLIAESAPASPGLQIVSHAGFVETPVSQLITHSGFYELTNKIMNGTFATYDASWMARDWGIRNGFPLPSVTVRYPNGTGHNTYSNGSNEYVWVGEQDADFPDVIIHEFGHLYEFNNSMFALQGSEIPGCYKGSSHFSGFDLTGSCFSYGKPGVNVAATGGFADFFPQAVYGEEAAAGVSSPNAWAQRSQGIGTHPATTVSKLEARRRLREKETNWALHELSISWNTVE